MVLWDVIHIEGPDIGSKADTTLKILLDSHLEQGLSSGGVLSHKVFACLGPTLVDVLQGTAFWVECGFVCVPSGRDVFWCRGGVHLFRYIILFLA